MQKRSFSTPQITLEETQTAGKSQQKRRMQTLIALVCALMLTVALSACAQESSPQNDQGSSEPAPQAETALTVNLKIDCKEAVDAENKTALEASEDGIMFDGTLDLEEGATIYDALVASGVNITSSDSSYGKYVSAINGLAAGDQGEMSGWIFTLNGEDVMVSADQQELADGDSIAFNFILEPEF